MAIRPVGKPRSSIAVILLSVITFGIYGLYWTYTTFQEMKDYSGDGIGGVLGLIISIIFGIVTIFLLPAEVGNLYGAEQQTKPVSGVTGFWLLLPIIGGIVWLVKVQGALSRFWKAHGAAA